MKKVVALIGAGNIGSRHLQALKKVGFPLKIIVVEPDSNSLITAKERYNSVLDLRFQHEIRYYNKTEASNEEIDLAIIATNSNRIIH